jgi:hypothetical protein
MGEAVLKENSCAETWMALNNAKMSNSLVDIKEVQNKKMDGFVNNQAVTLIFQRKLINLMPYSKRLLESLISFWVMLNRHATLMLMRIPAMLMDHALGVMLLL